MSIEVETRDKTWFKCCSPATSPRYIRAMASVGFWRLRTDSGPQQQRSVLDWYLEVG
jgi:hypothetical protein